jgi:hypothetical protein
MQALLKSKNKPFFPRAIEHLGVTNDVLPQG